METVVALALTLLVMASVFELASPAASLFRSVPEAAVVQQRLRYSFDRLFSDLMKAGRGTTEQRPGRLGRFLPPIVPYRLGRRAAGDAHRRPVADAVTVLSVSRDGGAETTTLGPIAGAATTVELAAEPGCRRPACGHRVRDMVLVFDEQGDWELFRVTAATAMRLALERVHATSTAFAAGAVIAPVNLDHYYFDARQAQLRHYDGWRADFPLVDQFVRLRFRFQGVAPGPTPCRPSPTVGPLVDIDLPRLRDGPWCGPSGLPFDADLLRIRVVVVTLRVQSGASELRGVDPRLFARPGSASGGRGTVPDHEVTFTLAPPNL